MMKISTIPSLLAIALLAGCAMLFQDAPPLQHYTLGAASPPQIEIADGERAELSDLSIGLRRVRLAEHLNNRFIVTRRQNHQVRFADHHRWAGQLDRGISTTVARYLSEQAPFARVDTAPWPGHAQYDYLIQLDVSRFEGSAPARGTGVAHLRVDWEIIRAADRELIVRGRTDHEQPDWSPGDFTALVAMLDDGLHTLTADLIDQLTGVVAQQPAQLGES